MHHPAGHDDRALAAASSQHSPPRNVICGLGCSPPRDVWRVTVRGAADHLHDTASRYDHAAKRLELLLTCPVCKTEKVIHSLACEPGFEPSVASVHALHARGGAAVDALNRAA